MSPESAEASGIRLRTNITLQDLVTGPGEYVILNYEDWNTDKLDSQTPEDGKNWQNGHFVNLISLSQAASDHPEFGPVYDLQFNDPASSGSQLQMRIRPVDSRYLGIQTFEVLALRAKTRLITNLVRIRVLNAPVQR